MNSQVTRALKTFRRVFDRDPAVVAFAPGRVNLIGDHTDYNGGWVMPCAIDRWVAVAMDEGPGVLVSADMDRIEPLTGCSTSAWAAHPRGIAWALSDSGYTFPPFHAAYAGDVPLGSGLSSSAAIQVATGLALNALFGLEVPPAALPRICQRAENRFVGVQSGIMDPFISVFAQERKALLLDCRSLDFRQISFDPVAAGIRLLVCHTGVDRRLASSGYNHRREVCEDAARLLDIAELRDATPGDAEKLSGERQRYCRHVVSENKRVLAAADSLERGDFERLGRLMFESHASLRDDYGVSTAQLDEFVLAAQHTGALGARLTGAGFGGCGLALVPDSRLDGVVSETRRRYLSRDFSPPTFYELAPTNGAVASRLRAP